MYVALFIQQRRLKRHSLFTFSYNFLKAVREDQNEVLLVTGLCSCRVKIMLTGHPEETKAFWFKIRYIFQQYKASMLGIEISFLSTLGTFVIISDTKIVRND